MFLRYRPATIFLLRLFITVLAFCFFPAAWSSCRPLLSDKLQLTIPSLSYGNRTLRATLDFSVTNNANQVLKLVSYDDSGIACDTPATLSQTTLDLILPEVEYLGVVYTGLRFHHVLLANGDQTFQSNPPPAINSNMVGNWKMVWAGQRLGTVLGVVVYSPGADAGMLSIDASGNYTWGTVSGTLTQTGAQTTCTPPVCWVINRGSFTSLLLYKNNTINIIPNDPFVFFPGSSNSYSPIIGSKM